MKVTIPILENDIVALSELNLENYHHLISIGAEDKLVQYSPSAIGTPDALRSYVELAIQKYEENSAIPFIIFDKRAQKFAGSTRFMNIDWKNKVIEIGSTWIGRAFHGSGLNSATKELMLNYAFTTLNFEKVEFRIDERNIRSRKAVEKLHAKLEGVLRENVYLLDGYKRNTCCYGILRSEWNSTL